ncbi:MAG: isochorismatase [Bacteroidetes bacterium GWC2_33_15]|nr:MAG: isochorismatase [Bacteroidetes bacterium GWA2_33_15]OFX48843.1 MAG: isochorismatase [Bacteroidetes bacterium GWC2_33_15]OFX66086.1 MAG: isochorismatase [Bacteroidetes bacterium GWB2_32_14]OFX68152.1 MAG: isochorismatase [Bacteroidetes bacterium GWD2_33_33]HAN17924.1 cysteine hydrolase [Bacteroidales bacterium]
MKGLLIVDMQKISFTPETPRFDAEGVVKRINSLSDYFRKNGDKVIFIQHDGSKGNFCIPGSVEWEIIESLNVDNTDIIVGKTANDSFYNSNLNEILKGFGIEEIVITGCATDFCVDATVKSALTNNYKVTVIANGHTTANRPHLNADKIIEHYNWIWKEMIPVNGNIAVVDLENYLNSLNTIVLV